jgi:hypothetical protein
MKHGFCEDLHKSDDCVGRRPAEEAVGNSGSRRAGEPCRFRRLAGIICAIPHYERQAARRCATEPPLYLPTSNAFQLVSVRSEAEAVDYFAR